MKASCFSVPKDSETPESNEDKFCFHQDGQRLALCDGASESFDSKYWAELLAHRFTEDSQVNPDWVDETLRQYLAAHDLQSMSWSKQAAFERGSFSTLLGVEVDEEHNSVHVLAVGDSIAMLVSEGDVCNCWPFCDPEQFKKRPTLLATVAEHNDFIRLSDFMTKCRRTFTLDGLDHPLLLCMTDALGEWALKQIMPGADGIGSLLHLSSQEEFMDLVRRERSAKRMRIDDSTLIILSFAREPIDGIPVA